MIWKLLHFILSKAVLTWDVYNKKNNMEFLVDVIKEDILWFLLVYFTFSVQER